MLEQLVKPEITAQFDRVDREIKDPPLKVKVYSFSFKKGMPADISGHGGGFVFDCRGILNPGRFEAYKKLTGRETEVIEFLQHKTRMPEFLEHVFDAIDITVDDYLERGFDHLSVSFGCTGGQHRSVYAAETLVKHLKEKYGLEAEVLHLEQDKHELKRR